MPSLSTFFNTSPSKKPSSNKPRPKSTPTSSSKKSGSSRASRSSAQAKRQTSSPQYPDLTSRRHQGRSPGHENLHPLNLPPLERERRLSAMSTSSAGPSTPGASDPVFENGSADSTTDTESVPVPPPYTSSPPPPEPKVDPEDHKNLGNKYFKARDYEKAAAEYTKGMCL